MTKVTLKNLPVTIDIEPLALGLIGLFTDEERDVLRFGMLPAKKMEVLESQLRDKFNGLGQHPREIYPKSMTADTEFDESFRMSTVNGEIVEWDIDKLVSEAMHEVSVAIYQHGELVV